MQNSGKLDPHKHTHHFTKIQNVWDSAHYADFGIERLLRLFLVGSKILFPGIYIEYLTKSSSLYKRKLVGEFYVIFKTLVPFFMLYFSLWNHMWLYIFNIYLLIETFLYIFHKIFLPEHDQSKMINRSIILLFFNFIEVIASFGVIYAAGNYLNQPIQGWIDALYFSFITGVTIGYGDFYPVNENGKILVMLQILSTMAFLFLFFNFFGPRSGEKFSQHQESSK
ncbi:MAG: ion channel [Daejeonella sp.]|uniref:potassium channel family protein n=1 Tax=Daejeonella sp. TaxID=2805397 RepID=UPI00273357AE|nr:potassium channel family protein [Daejeonella sp.]MDP3467439.1 ion channel [Daejeonella sp.]